MHWPLFVWCMESEERGGQAAKYTTTGDWRGGARMEKAQGHLPFNDKINL